jgi:hypothetical protein
LLSGTVCLHSKRCHSLEIKDTVPGYYTTIKLVKGNVQLSEWSVMEHVLYHHHKDLNRLFNIRMTSRTSCFNEGSKVRASPVWIDFGFLKIQFLSVVSKSEFRVKKLMGI